MGLTLSNPSTSVNSKLLVTKSDTAGEALVGSSVSISGANGTSSWVQVSASLSADTLITQVAFSSSSAMASSFTMISVDIAIGGSGSEVVVATVPLVVNGVTGRLALGRLGVAERIASGQRLAVRYTDSGASGATLTCSVYGVLYANLEGN